VVNAKEAQCNYMTYIVTYRSNIFIQFGSDSNTDGNHCYISVSLYCNYSKAL